jgi:hypothetical protein
MVCTGERQLSTHHHEWAPAADPPLIGARPGDESVPAFLDRRLFMVDRIEDLHELSLYFDGAGNHDVAAEQPPDSLGNRRLAVAGRTVDEHRVSAVQRWSDLVDERIPDDDV